MTVGYEGVGPKKPRIQLKIAPSSEGKEGASPVQGTSDSMSGQGKKGQASLYFEDRMDRGNKASATPGMYLLH